MGYICFPQKYFDAEFLCVHIQGCSHNALGLTGFSEDSGVKMRVFCHWNFRPLGVMSSCPSPSSPFFPLSLSVFALVSPPPSPFLLSPHPLPCSLASYLSLPLSPSPWSLCTSHHQLQFPISLSPLCKTALPSLKSCCISPWGVERALFVHFLTWYAFITNVAFSLVEIQTQIFKKVMSHIVS